MTLQQEVQLTSLTISIAVAATMIILFIFKKRQRAFYISMFIGWLSGIVFYVLVLYFYEDFQEIFNISAQDASALLRLFQYIIFGSWFILDGFEAIYIHIKERDGVKRLKNFILNLFKRTKKVKYV